MNKTVNSNYDDSLSMIDDSKQLTQGIESAIISISNLIQSIENVITDNEGNLKDSRNASIEAVLNIIDKSIDLTNDSGKINDSNNTIHDAIKDEIDDTEDDSNVLNMDNEHELVSFTSNKNPEPQSIQIILRTQEISLDDDDDNGDLEKSDEDEGVLARITKIFKKIINCFIE